MTNSARAIAAATAWTLSLAACAAPSPPVDPGADGRNPDTTETTMPTPPVTGRATAESRPLVPGRFVTRADDGRVLAMQVGETRELRTRDGRAPEPSIEGEAVRATEIDYVGDSGGRSWELRAIAPGRSRVVVTGREPFAVTVEVSAAR